MTAAPEPGSPLPQWRRLAGYVVVAVLAVVLIALSLRSDRSATDQPVSTGVGSSPVVSTFPRPSSSVVTDSGAPVATAPSPADVEDEVRSAAVRALDAWGEFAVTGDLDTMQPWVWNDGPQWVNLESEAPGIIERDDTGPAYAVGIAESAIDMQNDTAILTGSVSFTRLDEQDQTYRWVLSFERRDGEWRIWSVTDGA